MRAAGCRTRGQADPGARWYGTSTPPAIDLVDGDILCELLRDLKLGVTTRLVPEIEIVEGFFQEI